MPHRVTISLLMPALLLATPPAAAQFSRFGLSGRTVMDLALFRGSLYAATDTGVYVTTVTPPDSGWKLVGLAGMQVRSLHPHDVGPLSWTITAGLELTWNDSLTSRTWCLNPATQQWDPTDHGINRSEMTSVDALDGFPSLAVCGETFAGGLGKVYRHAASGGIWELVFDIGIGQVNAIATAGSTVMAGGETGIFAPFIARSSDKGESWETFFPDMAGDNACDALAFGGSGVVYAGMEGAVIRSNDFGVTWQSAGLEGTPYYFFGLAADSMTGTVFAGGVTNTGGWGLYVLKNGEGDWTRLDPSWSVRGIRSLTLLATPLGETHTVFIGTDGDGALLLQEAVVAVRDAEGAAGSLEVAAHPNPFNGATTVTVRLPDVGRVAIRVYDLLGRQVATVHDGSLGPGQHRFVWAAGGLASGAYVCRVSFEGATGEGRREQHIKMMYLR